MKISIVYVPRFSESSLRALNVLFAFIQLANGFELESSSFNFEFMKFSTQIDGIVKGFLWFKLSNFIHFLNSFQLKTFQRIQHISNFISALTVRFLTKRYIGEYDHQAGMKG
jgi:hypothetical protein